MSQGSRIALILAAVVVLAGGLLVASGGDDSKSGSSATTIVVKDAKPEGGVQKITVNKGDEVRFTVKSDTADEIHVHGYNLMKDVKAGGQVSFAFKATIDGGFEIELEQHRQQIASLTVTP